MIDVDVTSAGRSLRPLRWLTYAGIPSIPLSVWQSTRPEWMTAAVVAAVVVVLALDAVLRRP